MQAMNLLRSRPQAFSTGATTRCHRPRICVLTRADNNPFEGPGKVAAPPSGTAASKASSDEERERALELLERRSRGQVAKARKAIPIRNQTEAKQEADNSNMAPWKEGALFPEGWDNMNLGTKVTELYLGRRGILFWANKSAYASVFILIGGWVLFRIVGPNLGLYKLEGDLMPPPY